MIEEILLKARKYNPNMNEQLIRDAYDFAHEAYYGHIRLNGESFLEHSVIVTNYLLEVKVDSATIAAALLHDTVDKEGVSVRELEKRFGEGVAAIVAGVHRLQGIRTKIGESGYHEKLRHLILVAGKDVRVILIRLAEKLHNLETSEVLDESDRTVLLEKVLQIYAPLAEHLGVAHFKRRLEDHTLRHLEPELFAEIMSYYENKGKERKEYLGKMQQDLEHAVEHDSYSPHVFGRTKNHYSVYRKLLVDQRRNKSGVTVADYLEQLNDKYAFTVLVNTIEQCYQVLDSLHQYWKYDQEEFDDYIANPKPNGYQSLQTTLLAHDDERVEVQVRTHEMHEYNEFGPASHIFYKEQRRDKASRMRTPEQKMELIKSLVRWQEETVKQQGDDELMKLDVFGNRVFVFTPNGDLHDLPKSATPVDFAYAVHTDIGHSMVGAKVNGKIVALDFELSNEDVCEVIIGKRPQGPSRDWLNLAKSSSTRAKIRKKLNTLAEEAKTRR